MPDPEVRRRINLLNLSTPLGLALAAAGGATVGPWRDGLLLASGHHLPYPPAPAFTVGNVVLVRASRVELERHDAMSPALMEHESRHATQYAWFGPLMIPLYLGACAWSWARTGDWWSRNAFERRAGLTAGGYLERPTRALAPAVLSALRR